MKIALQKPGVLGRCYFIVLSFFALFDIFLLYFNGVPSGSVYKPTALTVSLVASATLISLYPVIRNFLNQGDPLEPICVLSGVFFLYMPMSAAGIAILELRAAYPAFRINVSILLEPLTIALALMNIGMLTFYIGYYRFPEFELPGPYVVSAPRWSKTLIVIAWLVGIVSQLLMYYEFVLRNAFFHFLSTWIYYVPPLALYAGLESRPLKGWRSLFTITLIGNAAIIFLLDFNLHAILTQSITILLVYHYSGPGISHRDIVKLTSGFTMLFPLEMVAARLRGDGFVGGPIEHFVTRMIGTESMTMVVYKVPEFIPYEKGQTFVLALYSFVPRAIWSEKPMVSIMPKAAHYFAGRPEGNGGARITLPAEFYWNFGFSGVVFGMLVYGASVALIYLWFRQRWKEGYRGFTTLLFFSIAFLCVIEFEGSVMDTYVNLFKQMLFAFLFIVFTSKRSERYLTSLASPERI